MRWLEGQLGVVDLWKTEDEEEVEMVFKPQTFLGLFQVPLGTRLEDLCLNFFSA